jgi:hypothetical protein
MGGGVNATSWPLYPRERGPLPIAQDAGPQGRSGRVQKTSPPRGFDLRTVKPVASRYTDCSILAHTQSVKDEKRLWSVSGVCCGRCLEVISWGLLRKVSGSNKKEHEKYHSELPFSSKIRNLQFPVSLFYSVRRDQKPSPYLFPIFFILCCSFGLCIVFPCSGMEFQAYPLI